MGGVCAPPPFQGGGRETAVSDALTFRLLPSVQAGGHSIALRATIEAERRRGPEFLRLANALSALYPRASPEKRLLDAMLLAAPR